MPRKILPKHLKIRNHRVMGTYPSILNWQKIKRVFYIDLVFIYIEIRLWYRKCEKGDELNG